MNTPVIELIAENIKTAVNAITVVNGFNQDLVAVRPKRNVFANVNPEDKKVLIIQADEEEIKSPYGAKDWMQTFILAAFVIDSDDASESIDTRINKIRADVQKKLQEDIRRGGHALNTFNRPSVIFDSVEYTGIEINIEVHYRTKTDDPYSKI